MNEFADVLSGRLVIAEDDLAAEFEARLADSATLAFRVAYSVVRQWQDAEDVAQDAFARAYRRFHQLRDRERFRAWLVRMTFRLALDYRRAAVRRSAREDAVGQASPTSIHGEVHAIEQERVSRLWAAIDDLPERLRLVVVLSAIEGHSVRDVAALVGAPEGTVKSRLFEARAKLRERLR